METIFRIYPLLIFFIMSFAATQAQDTIYIDLEQAHEIAENNNQLVQIFQYKIENAHAKLDEMKSHYYPRLELDASYAYNSNPDIHAKKGEFSHIYHDLIDVGWIDDILDEYFPLPPKDMVLVHGDEFFYKTSLSLYQPVSQLTSINTGRKVAVVDYKITQAEKEKVVSEIKTAVTELFYGILLEEKYEEAAKTAIEFKKMEYLDARNAYEVGEVLELDVFAMEAEIHEKEQELIKTKNKKESYLLKLKQLLNLETDNIPVLIDENIFNNEVVLTAPDDLVMKALSNNTDLQIADMTVEKAAYGIDAAKKDYIPELVYFMQYNLNHGIPLYPDQYLVAGLNLKWTLVAAGERRAVVRQREALRNEALLDFEYRKNEIRNKIEDLYLDILYAKKLIETANKALTARKEEFRLVQDAFEEGEALNTKLLEAKADLEKAQANLFAARINLLIKHAKLEEVLNLN